MASEERTRAVPSGHFFKNISCIVFKDDWVINIID